MTSSPPPPPLMPIPHDERIDDNANDDDAQSDISVPYSSLTESTTTTTSGNGFLTPTSSDAHTVAAEGVNLQTINSVLHEIDSSNFHDGRIDDSLAQWRSLYHDEIEWQIVENRNRDRERSNTITNNLSARNLQLHTSQTSETLAGEGGGGARLHDNGQTRRGEKGERSKSSPSDSSSTSSGSSSSIKLVFNLNFTIHHLLFVFVLLLAFLVAYLRLSVLSLSAPTTDSASASNISHDDQDQFPPLTVFTPAPTEKASHSRSSTPTPAYESASTPPSYAGAQESKPGPPPSPSRYTRHADPQPNQSFILLEASTGRALTLIDGHLRLVYVPDPDLISLTDQKGSDPYLFPNSGAEQPCVVKGQCNWHWHCVENSGWLGFRNAASGTFSGHDMWQNIIARVYRHQGWEFMAVRPALERKGWYLMVTHWEKLHKINFLEGPGAFVARNPEEGTIWEFVRV